MIGTVSRWEYRFRNVESSYYDMIEDSFIQVFEDGRLYVWWNEMGISITKPSFSLSIGGWFAYFERNFEPQVINIIQIGWSRIRISYPASYLHINL